MVTENFKNLLAMVLESSSAISGGMRARDVTGRVYYLHGAFGFPSSRTETYTLDAAAAGVSFGTGERAAAETDYQLQSHIGSGITVSLTSRTVGCDSPGNPWIQYAFTITNNTGDTLTIREVGYKQLLKSATTPGRTANVDAVYLLDRTVLASPLEIANGDAGVLVYKLKTNPIPEKTISGVKIVSWSYGSDADVAAMITAARSGTIDLQEDGGWAVGDVRKIHMDAWTGGNNVAHAAQDIDIIISSFEEYSECGNVLQFDFLECPTGSQRMNASNTTTGGYGATEMYTTTLPAMVNALPSWLKNLLITFDVVATKGANSTELETVSDNQLALRSASEVFGAGHNGKAMEGAQIDLYKVAAYRVKAQGWSGSTVGWWERSPTSATNFCCVSGNGAATINGASSANGVSPFGCI